ncbi:hypothetical protein CYMTET_11724 [Cymbomonas tetramitiformis]|uniref:Uncharacterized protein n=1 Tax=Cymbomonas tetramitiformis TaxID=36881 RepID=A0AAE0GLZ5_9CHLO|nr:hypothetical protein CYMTET_11724 [Cymbomonas tetramitiformis]
MAKPEMVAMHGLTHPAAPPLVEINRNQKRMPSMPQHEGLLRVDDAEAFNASGCERLHGEYLVLAATVIKRGEVIEVYGGVLWESTELENEGEFGTNRYAYAINTEMLCKGMPASRGGAGPSSASSSSSAYDEILPRILIENR